MHGARSRQLVVEYLDGLLGQAEARGRRLVQRCAGLVLVKLLETRGLDK